MNSESIIKMLIDNNNPHEQHKQSDKPILVDESFLFDVLNEMVLYRKTTSQAWWVFRELSKENSPVLGYESVRELLKRLSHIYGEIEHEKGVKDE